MTQLNKPRAVLVFLLVFVVLFVAGALCSSFYIEPAAGILLVCSIGALTVACVLALSD